MHKTMACRISILLVLVLALALSSSATPHLRFNDLFKRAPQVTGGSSAGTTSSPGTTTPTTPTTPTTQPTTSRPPTTTTPTPPTTTSPTSTPPTSPSTQAPPQSTPNTTPTSKITTTEPLLGSTTIYSTTVVVTTNADNVVITSTSVAQLISMSTTGTATRTLVPGLSSTDGANSNNGNGGLSDQSKKVIAGVVGGVGGVILLAGIALVCWRIWGKRNRYNPNDDIDYTARTGQGLNSSGSAKENLADDNDHENRYISPHKPNTAANF